MALPVTLVTLGGVPVQLVDQTGSVFPTTGTGSLVFNTTPTLVTPILGAATGTSLALGGAVLTGEVLAVTGTTQLNGNLALGGAASLFTNYASYITGSGRTIAWGSSSIGSQDLTLSRSVAGILRVGTTTANASGGVEAATLALGGATIGGNALAVTGTAEVSGNTAIGSTTTTYDSFVARASAASAKSVNAGQLSIVDTTSAAINVGGKIGFIGNYTGTTAAIGAAIEARKTNGTGGNYSFGLAFQTRVNGAGSPADALVLGDDKSATFSGSIAIANTVNAVSPTSPNRTVTMVIGGTTYYLAAKTTND